MSLDGLLLLGLALVLAPCLYGLGLVIYWASDRLERLIWRLFFGPPCA